MKVGEGVTLVAPGSRVILNNIPQCDKCKQCQSSFSNICATGGLAEQKGVGVFDETNFESPFTLLDGSPAHYMLGPVTFATHCILPETWLTPYSHDISFEEAALIGISFSFNLCK